MGGVIPSVDGKPVRRVGGSRCTGDEGRCPGHTRPEHLIADSWQQKPESAGCGSKSGVSAAIWGSRADHITEFRRPALERHHVLTIRLQEFRADRWQNGQLVAERDTRIGSSCVTLAGAEARSVIYGSWRSLQLYLPAALLAETAEQADLPPLRAGGLDSGLAYDPQLHAIGGTIAGELEHQKPGSRLQLDSLGSLVCVHLLRRAGGGSAGQGGSRGGLARWQVKRAMECIAERLHENLTLAALAEEVGLSQYHFARAFKQSTGLTPHRYLLHCRLERAKELLAGTDSSIADIAARVGYSEATQLSRLFQTELATSPSAYRRMSVSRYAELARREES